MGASEFFAQTRDDYRDARARAAVLIDLEAELPAQVFRPEGGLFDFCDFGWCTGPDFLPVLRSLAELHGDDFITVVLPDRHTPKRLERYESSDRGMPAATFPAVRIDALYELGAGADLLQSADELAIVGSSGRWAIYGEYSWEVAVLWSANGPRVWQEHDTPFLTEFEAVELVDHFFSSAGHALSEDTKTAFVVDYEPREAGDREYRVGFDFEFTAAEAPEVFRILEQNPDMWPYACVYDDRLDFAVETRTDSLEHALQTALVGVRLEVSRSMFPGRLTRVSATDDVFFREWDVDGDTLIPR